jgi:hypothetical protein
MNMASPGSTSGTTSLTARRTTMSTGPFHRASGSSVPPLPGSDARDFRQKRMQRGLRSIRRANGLTHRSPDLPGLGTRVPPESSDAGNPRFGRAPSILVLLSQTVRPMSRANRCQGNNSKNCMPSDALGVARFRRMIRALPSPWGMPRGTNDLGAMRASP